MTIFSHCLRKYFLIFALIKWVLNLSSKEQYCIPSKRVEGPEKRKLAHFFGKEPTNWFSMNEGQI